MTPKAPNIHSLWAYGIPFGAGSYKDFQRTDRPQLLKTEPSQALESFLRQQDQEMQACIYRNAAALGWMRMEGPRGTNPSAECYWVEMEPPYTGGLEGCVSCGTGAGGRKWEGKGTEKKDGAVPSLFVKQHVQSLSEARNRSVRVCSDGHFSHSPTGHWGQSPRLSSHRSQLHCTGRGRTYLTVRLSRRNDSLL